MKESEILSMIDKGRQGSRIHLGKKQGLQCLTGEDVPLLSHLLQTKYPSTMNLALEDLEVSDHDAVLLAKLVTALPLTAFSLQGIYLGDQCVCAIYEALTEKTTNEKRTQVLPDTSGSIVTSTATSALKSLIIAGLKVTDSSLYVLAHIIIHNPTLRKVSINWASGFTLEAALFMVKNIAVHNISLVDSDFHGFLYDADNDNPKGIHFINLFIKYVMNRNKELLTLAADKKYPCYCDSFSAYNETLSKHFLLTQKKYELDELCANDFLCEPLTQKDFDQLVAKQAYAAAEFSSVQQQDVASETARVSVSVSDQWHKPPITPIAIGNFDSPDSSLDLADALMNPRTAPTNNVPPPVVQPSHVSASSSSSSSLGLVEREVVAVSSTPLFSAGSAPVITTKETKSRLTLQTRYSEAAPITTALKPGVEAIEQGLASLHMPGAFVDKAVMTAPQKSPSKKST